VKKARLKCWICLQLACAAMLAYPACARAVSVDDITTVASRTSDDYVRAKLSDGSVKPEFYAFGEGGQLTGITDATIKKLSFIDVARTIAGPLAAQNYVPTRDAGATKLLILVYWGRTNTPQRSDDSLASQQLQDASAAAANIKHAADQQGVVTTSNLTPGGAMVCGHFAPQPTVADVGDQIDSDNAFTGAMALAAAENRARDQANALNAQLLGFDSEWNASASYVGTPREFRRQDLVNELETSRYFVVLMAYDFQMMWKQKKHKLLWETRVSIRQQHHEFDKELLAMAQHASPFFGRDSHGLVRREVPQGRVDIGDIKLVDSGSAR